MVYIPELLNHGFLIELQVLFFLFGLSIFKQTHMENG